MSMSVMQEPTPLESGPLIDSVQEVADRLSLDAWLGDGPLSVVDLARVTGTHRTSLYRFLRVLASLHTVDEVEPGIFARTGVGAFARTRVGTAPAPALSVPELVRTPTAVATAASVLGSMFSVPSMLYSVRTGKPAARAITGLPAFDYIGSDPEASATMAAFTAEATERAAPAIVSAADFNRFTTIVDVGGGTGTLMKHILLASRATHGVVYDTAASRPAGVRVLASVAELAGRWEVRAGDFFDSVPPGGDAYVLKSVLHDWDDTAATRILRNCRKAMEPSARLLIFEPVLPRLTARSPAPLPAVISDLVCLVMTDGGRERTEAEFRALLDAADLAAASVAPVPGSSHLHCLEAVTA